ncbi:autotransporter translocation and assembly factor TamB [Aliiruegeria haliotis]|uniref:Autotransporter translocation and assembly factor TamB n=1 Tax=Aliiruegeria haliotis TaxID=1280846 RepID=A0A2T0RLC8_9RHOB|nr:translocation/assembly module TamB domain-containing protein [Aliiruegeria haliotis]PRY21913.1 autotransporter translocation and assembly factor TamB [Aliiruegeria haliotis]
MAGHAFGSIPTSLRVLAPALLVLLLFVAQPVSAQQKDDKGFVTQLLQTLLSRKDSDVAIIGLRGVARGPVSIDRVSVTDVEGEWLTIHDLVMDWDRAALLRKNVVFHRATAKELHFRRPPVAGEADVLDRAEARGFRLPELPVGFHISELAIPRILADDPAFDVPAELELLGRTTIAGGDGLLELEISRIDHRNDYAGISGSYDGDTGDLSVTARVQEDAGGVVSELLGLPGSPSIDLSVEATGTGGDVDAEFDLLTSDIERLSGTFVRRVLPQGGSTFDLSIGGDPRALFEAEFRDFFGASTEILMNGQRNPDGSIELERLSVESAELLLEADAALDPDGHPREIRIRGRIADPDGGRVLLPVPGRREIDTALLTGDYDATRSDRWSIRGTVEGYSQEDAALERMDFTANGVGTWEEGSGRGTADIVVEVAGLEIPDTPVARALGSNARLTARLERDDDTLVDLPQVNLEAAGASASLSGDIQFEDRQFVLTGAGGVTVPQLSLFDWPAGLDLAGTGTLDVGGWVDILGGEAEASITGTLDALQSDRPIVNRVLGQEVEADLSFRRTTEGTEIDPFTIRAEGIQVTASGSAGTNLGQAQLEVDLSNAASIIPQVSGPATLRGRLEEGPEEVWQTDLRLDGPIGGRAELTGTLQEAASRLRIAATLPRMPLLPPPFDGAIAATGQISQNGDDWRLALGIDGPGPVASQVEGARPHGGPLRADLTGTFPLNMLDAALSPNEIVGTGRFSLALTGTAGAPPRLSGGLDVQGASLALPDLSERLHDIGVQVRLSDGSMKIAGSANGQAGGQLRMTGDANLEQGLPLSVTTVLDGIIFQRWDILKSRVDGRLTLAGSMTGRKRLSGSVTIGETELYLSPQLLTGGGGEIPNMRHRNASAAVQLTRERARLSRNGQTPSDAPPIDLDIAVSVPETIQITGRYISARMGGNLRIGGTAQTPRSDGQVRMLDGRLNLMGRRLDLISGVAWLQGDMTPWIELTARGETRDITLRTTISGPVTDLRIDYTSHPYMQDEDAVSVFLFGNAGYGLSALQLLEILNGARILTRPNALVLGDAINTPESGLAPSATPRPAGRDLLARVKRDVEGRTSLVLELELDEDFSILGRTREDGNTGIGFLYGHDY